MGDKDHKALEELIISDGIHFYKMGVIENLETTSEEEGKTFDCSNTMTATFEAATLSKNIVFYYIFGRSNNWLRMHGYPTIRKRGIHKGCRTVIQK